LISGGELVGEFFADIYIEARILLELKSARAIVSENISRVLNYLKVTGFEVALPINFGARNWSTEGSKTDCAKSINKDKWD
jgi:GxxExxY protein